MNSGDDKAEAVTGQKAAQSKAAKETQRRSRRDARRDAVRDRVARKRARAEQSAAVQSSGKDRVSTARSQGREDGASGVRRAPDDSGVRRARDDIDTVGQAGTLEFGERAPQRGRTAPSFGTGFAPTNPRPSTTMPMPMRPLDSGASPLRTAPRAAPAAPALPASPAQVAAPKSIPAFATAATAVQQVEPPRPPPRAAAKSEPASELSPLRMALLAFAGILAFGTVLRMVVG